MRLFVQAEERGHLGAPGVGGARERGKQWGEESESAARERERDQGPPAGGCVEQPAPGEATVVGFYGWNS